ncbi:hypothetical protein ZIOFF_015882 [Zingiber officinale]|uniref:Uncharacterized protein n=1 Tax=Zingiber officinale TaxID=94328 RepID=A0A8J5HRV2_ZINOF|nr:hypothetical protein ZIOFF_015882 [Zingiber officinale]
MSHSAATTTFAITILLEARSHLFCVIHGIKKLSAPPDRSRIPRFLSLFDATPKPSIFLLITYHSLLPVRCHTSTQSLLPFNCDSSPHDSSPHFSILGSDPSIAGIMSKAEGAGLIGWVWLCRKADGYGDTATTSERWRWCDGRGLGHDTRKEIRVAHEQLSAPADGGISSDWQQLIGIRAQLQEVTNAPNLDAIASTGVNGLMDPVEAGLVCGSDTAHLSLLGYDPRIYYRG